MTRARFVKLSVLAAAAALLTGCGVHPGDAAVVGDESISADQVDAVASGLCTLKAGSAAAQGMAVPSRNALQGALQVMLDSELSRQFGVAEGVQPDQAKLAAAVASSQGIVDRVRPEDRAAIRDAIVASTESQLVLTEAGRRYLVQHGIANPNANQAASAGARLRLAFAKTLDITVDPRYGTYTPTNGGLGADNGSLSVPASSFAQAGAVGNPAQDWVQALPASQKCS